MPRASTAKVAVKITRLQQVSMHMRLLGTTPLLMNRMPKKAQEQLLLPPRRTNLAARQQTLKHDPYREFCNSIYRCRDEKAPTLVHLPDNSIKKAMANTAIDVPGATKAQIGRLITIATPTVHVYGVPKLHMSVVRQAGINKTPDIRTRACFEEWAVEVEIKYIMNIITQDDVLSLAASAGLVGGVGDGRQEKGTLSCGLWDVVGDDDRDWHRIVKDQGRAAQLAAMKNPNFSGEDTEELYSWYQEEILRRDRAPVLPEEEEGEEELAALAVVAASGNGQLPEVQS
jgi:hypothetical protein